MLIFLILKHSLVDSIEKVRRTATAKLHDKTIKKHREMQKTSKFANLRKCVKNKPSKAIVLAKNINI